MDNKSIAIIILVIIIAIGGIYLLTSKTAPNTVQNNTTINNTGNHTKTITNHTHINETVKTNITAAQAKEITKQYIGEPGAYPGTPKLIYVKASGGFKGGYVWEVPIILNGKEVDAIGIDAQTGENLGEI